MAWKGVGVLTALLGFVLTASLSAHHSRAMFDVNELVSVEGTVTKVEWRNPHMWVTMDVPVADGKTESWGFEGSGAASMVASGISPQILKVGNRVKIIALSVIVSNMNGTTAFSTRTLGFVAIGCILVWSATQVITAIKVKMLYVEPEQSAARRGG